MNPRYIPVILLAALMVACGPINRNISIEDGSTINDDVTNVNGSIAVGRECRINGEVTNVNGRIHIGEESQVGAVRNTNGSISLEQAVHSGGIRNVNGSVSIADSAVVSGAVQNTNGRVEIGEGGKIGGDVRNVNGRMTIAAGTVVDGTVSSVSGQIHMVSSRAAGLVNTNGGIELLDGTHIAGELHMKRPGGVSFSDPPRVVIGRDVTVDGPLRFEREVELFVHETATVGEITGAEPVTFSGDTP